MVGRIRRRKLPTELASRLSALRDVIGELERAKAALIDAVPTTRAPGRPLADALAEFEERVRAAADAMPTWRAPELEPEWTACAAALEESLASVERLRLTAADPGGFEGLIATIGDLLDPLDAFARAGDRFRELRV